MEIDHEVVLNIQGQHSKYKYGLELHVLSLYNGGSKEGK